MALTSWKILNFFEVAEVNLPDEDSSSIFDSNELSCLCSGSDNLFVASNDGHVRILSQTFRVLRTFKAHESGTITNIRQVEGTSLLITISEDLSNEPLLKVWALDQMEKKSGAPKCLSTLSIQNGRKQFPISAFAILENLSQLAVGFGNGAVTVIRGDLIHDRGAKQRTVFESEEPITGVEFREGPNTTLYLATTGRILTLTITGKGQGQPAKVLDDKGCGVGCMTVDEANGDIVVVRDDAIHYYGVNGRGPSFAYEGPKQLVSIFGDFIALVAPPKSNRPTQADAFRKTFGSGRNDDLFQSSTFAILDTDLKFIAHTETLVNPIKSLFIEWGDLFILTLEGKLFRYHEKTLQQKLEILYQRDLYILAINLAQKAGVDVAQRNVILRNYGDYLHKKGDYDTAMQQYLKAIDNTEPSQVIRKFLDSQRINNLIEYLEELHDHNKATVDHTTLLLNCYAKLKDTDKLENFIKSGTNFDLETAISMCRQGGYYDQAVFLAKKNKEHDLVIDILIEDSKKYTEALFYIWRLDPDLAYPNLMRYARVLLEHCSDETTRMFIDYYTGNYKPKKNEPLPSTQTFQGYGAANAVSNLTSFIPLPYRQTSINPSPATAGNQQLALQEADAAEADAIQPPTEYDVPRPRNAFASFVDHPDKFIIFLEACLDQEKLEENDRVDLYTTLFEMYLETAKTKKGEEKELWESKAKNLIDGKDIPIDNSNVLLLSHLANFRDGTILVREQQGLRFDIFRSYTEANDTTGAIKALRKYGPEEPQLYPAALAYFTSSPKILEEAGDELDAVLKKIDQDGLMAPLQVIQTLSVNAVATMGMIKKYLNDTIEREQKEISNNRRLIESYRAETDIKRKEMDELGNKPTTFQASRCAACGRSLDLPTVHFLCKHSFHQSCLNETEGREAECPRCAAANSSIRAFRKAQEDSAERHDMFQDALQRSNDKFMTVSEFFGRGVMTAPNVD
ncbi:Vacuolar protein sorting-associated protein 11 [Lecanora helva]